MKKIFLAILPALLFAACKRMPIKTETRVYELTFIDVKLKFTLLITWMLTLMKALVITVEVITFIYIHLKHMSMYRLLSDIKE